MKKLDRRTRIGGLLLSAAVLAGCISACASKDEPVMKPTTDLNPGLAAVADHLYETTFTADFDWGTELTPASGAVGCSGIQVGQYRGRNYDWNYADTDLCIIHSTVTAKREHASVGIADLGFITDANGKVAIDQIPFNTVDGINDAGVCIQVNVMPVGENGEIPHTETTADDLNGGNLVRLILDYADTVEEALDLLKDRDIYSVFGEEELHWLISGPASASDKSTKTVVVEVFPDGLHVTENFVNDIQIMTNFCVSNFDGSPESVGWGMGYERWQILCENAAQADSVMGTFDLMEKVFYSKLYDLYGDRFWYSEYALTNLCNYYNEEDLKAYLGSDVYDACMKNDGGVFYVPELWDGEETIHGDVSKTGILAPVVASVTDKYKAQELGTSLWITIETAVYDLENRTLDIAVRESQDHYHFTIAG